MTTTIPHRDGGGFPDPLAPDLHGSTRGKRSARGCPGGRAPRHSKSTTRATTPPTTRCEPTTALQHTGCGGPPRTRGTISAARPREHTTMCPRTQAPWVDRGGFCRRCSHAGRVGERAGCRADARRKKRAEHPLCKLRSNAAATGQTHAQPANSVGTPAQLFAAKKWNGCISGQPVPPTHPEHHQGDPWPLIQPPAANPPPLSTTQTPSPLIPPCTPKSEGPTFAGPSLLRSVR